MINKEKVLNELKLKGINGAGDNLDTNKPYAAVEDNKTWFYMFIFPEGDFGRSGSNYTKTAYTRDEVNQILKDCNIPENQVFWY